LIVRLARSSTVAGTWFRVALLVTSAQVFLSYKQHEWHAIDFMLCCAMLLGTGIWAMTERHRHRLEFQRRRARWVCIDCGYDFAARRTAARNADARTARKRPTR